MLIFFVYMCICVCVQIGDLRNTINHPFSPNLTANKQMDVLKKLGISRCGQEAGGQIVGLGPCRLWLDEAFGVKSFCQVAYIWKLVRALLYSWEPFEPIWPIWLCIAHVTGTSDFMNFVTYRDFMWPSHPPTTCTTFEKLRVLNRLVDVELLQGIRVLQEVGDAVAQFLALVRPRAIQCHPMPRSDFIWLQPGPSQICPRLVNLVVLQKAAQICKQKTTFFAASIQQGCKACNGSWRPAAYWTRATDSILWEKEWEYWCAVMCCCVLSCAGGDDRKLILALALVSLQENSEHGCAASWHVFTMFIPISYPPTLALAIAGGRRPRQRSISSALFSFTDRPFSCPSKARSVPQCHAVSVWQNRRFWAFWVAFEPCPIDVSKPANGPRPGPSRSLPSFTAMLSKRGEGCFFPSLGLLLAFLSIYRSIYLSTI